MKGASEMVKKNQQLTSNQIIDLKMLDNKSLHDLIEYVSERLQNPVTIESPNFELISYSGSYQVLDDVRKETILGKKAPSYLIQKFKEEKIIELIESADGPVRVPAIEEIRFSKRIVACIRSNKKVLGYLWILESNRKLSAEDFQFLNEMIDDVAYLMVTPQREGKKAEEQLFIKLIEGHYTNVKMVELEAEMAGITFPEEFIIVVFYTTEHDEYKRIERYVEPFCTYEKKHSYLLKKEKQLIVLIGKEERGNQTVEEAAKHLASTIIHREGADKSKTLFVGVSQKSSRLLRLKNLYTEALEVINIRRSFGIKQIPFMYSNLGIYRLLSTIQERYAEEGYVNETIFLLKKYDVENKTELLHTLDTYLKCNCRMKETASSLFVHPNTLSYRLKRIFELTAIDFNDMNQRTITYIDLLLQKYNE
jgi:sugar diacid utilization regulator